MVDKSSPPDWKAQIDAIMSSETESNNICADCLTNATEWSVWNHGVFVCIKCAGIHRQLGVHISKVKSTQFDKWQNNQLQSVKNRGNITQNKQLEFRKPKYFINPSQCDGVEDVRRFYITQKYDAKIFMQEMKHDPGTYDMPQKVVIGTFLQENNKKKAYFQLLGRILYYFRHSHDSYDYEHYDVTTIDCTISSSYNDKTPFIMQIYKNNNKDDDDSLYRVRTTQNIIYLIDWVHAIRRAKQYYHYIDTHQNNNSTDEQKTNNNYIHLNKVQSQKPQSDPLKEITTKDLEQATILGIASKKGGGARSWRKRWWILLNEYLYYFKEDFRTSKKSKGIGIPQGYVLLCNADIIHDVDRQRTGKQRALMICTPERTFYVQPQQQTKDTFFNAVNECCSRLWDRKPFDFVTTG